MPSKHSPMPQIAPLVNLLLKMEKIKEPSSVPLAIHPSESAKSDALLWRTYFINTGRPTMAGPVINMLFIKVMSIIQNCGFCYAR